MKKFKDEENLVDTWKGAFGYPLLRELARETRSFWKRYV